jgi:hypothetical protein
MPRRTQNSDQLLKVLKMDGPALPRPLVQS